MGLWHGRREVEAVWHVAYARGECKETTTRECVGWGNNWSGLEGMSHTGDVGQSFWELICGDAGVGVANICS